MIPSSFYIGLAVFGAVFCVGYLVLRALNPYSAAVDSRLREMKGEGTLTRTGDAREAAGGGKTRERAAKWLSVVNRLVPNNEHDRRRHQVRLFAAGIYGPTALSTFFAIKLTLMVAPPLMGVLTVWWGFVSPVAGLLYGCSGGGFGMILPSFWLDRRIRRRHCVLRRSLPDMLDLMTVCLEGGLSLQSTFQRVGDELQFAHPVLAGELNIVEREIELGVSLDHALRRLADRTGYEGIRPVSTFVRDTQRHGSDLAEALRVHADMLRSQREADAEELAQKASVKILIPTLLLILPAVFVVLAGPAAIRIQEAFSK